jgi:transcriptional regulator with XRE-family HTH domain
MQKSRTKREYAGFLRHLRAARQKAGLTQIELARRLRSTQSFVSKCERGERRLDVVELRLWCEALGVPLPSFVNDLSRKPSR